MTPTVRMAFCCKANDGLRELLRRCCQAFHFSAEEQDDVVALFLAAHINETFEQPERLERIRQRAEFFAANVRQHTGQGETRQ